MKDQLAVTVQTFNHLSKKRLADVKRFVSGCKKLDGYLSVFYWSSIENRKNPGINEILYYGADDTLIGYVALYHFNENEIEITLIIDTAYRNPPIYTHVWEQIKSAIAECPVDITRFVFTINQSFYSFKEFLTGLGARMFECTYKLALTPYQFSKVKNHYAPELVFRKAIREDVPVLVQLEVDGFQVPESEYKQHLLKTMDEAQKEIMVAVKGEKIIGKVDIQFSKKIAYLYDLSIDVVEQGKGYGSALIYYALNSVFQRSFKKVLLDATNETYLNWYESFNFKCIATIEHWKMHAYLSPIKERERQLDAILLNFHSQPVQDQLSNTVYKH